MPYKDKAKHSAYQNKRMQKHRQEWIDSRGGKCELCGRDDLPFEVDHRDRAQKVEHRVWSWSKVRRDSELAKCQLLCQECHWKKTSVENTVERPHGINRYKADKCRCDVCKAAKKEENSRRCG